MPRRSKVSQLPPEILGWLERELVAKNFGAYAELTRKGNEMLRSGGYDEAFTFGKSALHRYGGKYERKIQALRTSTKAAQMFVEAAGDDEDALGGATISALQSRFFELTVALQEIDESTDPAEQIQLVSKAARAAADLQRASTGLRKWREQVRTKSAAAADAAARIAKKGGLSRTASAEIRREILGIAA